MSGGTLCPSAECPGGHSARGDNPPSHTVMHELKGVGASKQWHKRPRCMQREIGKGDYRAVKKSNSICLTGKRL